MSPSILSAGGRESPAFVLLAGAAIQGAQAAMGSYLFDQFLSQVPGPKALFIRTADGRVMDYGGVLGLLGLSARLAHALVALGVRPGDRVAVQAEKSPEAIALYLACLRAGAAYLPLNTAYTRAELEYFVADAQPALFVCAPGKEDAVAGVTV